MSVSPVRQTRHLHGISERLTCAKNICAVCPFGGRIFEVDREAGRQAIPPPILFTHTTVQGRAYALVAIAIAFKQGGMRMIHG